MLVLFTAPHALEKVQRSRGDLLHIPQVALDALRPAMTKEVGGEDEVSPGGVAHAYLLEEPAGVGAVAVAHVHRTLDGFLRVQWKK